MSASPGPLLVAAGRACGALACTIGMIVLAGWAFDVGSLWDFGAEGHVTVPWSAIGLTAAGIGALAARRRRSGLSWAAAAIAATIALVGATENLFGIDPGLDTLLFGGAVEALGAGHPGRPSVQTCAALAALALAAAPLADERWPWRVTAGMVGALIGGLALVARLMGATAFFDSSAVGSGGLAVPTGLASLPAGTGIVLTVSAEHLATTARSGSARQVLVLVLPASVIVPFLAVSGTWLTSATSGIGPTTAPLVVAAAVTYLTTVVWRTAVHVARLDDEATEARAAVQRLLDNQRTQLLLYGAAVESSADAILTTTLGGTITGWNRGAEKLYGYAEREAMGRDVRVLVPTDLLGPVDDIFERVARGEGSAGFEIECVSKLGLRIPVEGTVSPVFGDDGEVIGASAIARDLTERRRAAAAMEARTAELERSNAELEQFAYVASHDLQEPLRMIVSYTELLAERYQHQLDDRADKYVHYIVDGGQRMRQLICDLLAYSRVGSRGGEMAVVPLEAVVERTVVSLQRLFDETGTELTWGRLPGIVTDPGQIGVVLQNLLTNAVKFRSDLPPVLRIDAEHDAAGMWVISVTDNGIGIDPAQGERIFEMFQRLHERDRYEGSGIGLAIVRKVVERHGGRVGFEPAPGGGARFWFTAHGPDGADTMSTAATSSAPSAR